MNSSNGNKSRIGPLIEGVSNAKRFSGLADCEISFSEYKERALSEISGCRESTNILPFPESFPSHMIEELTESASRRSVDDRIDARQHVWTYLKRTLIGPALEIAVAHHDASEAWAALCAEYDKESDSRCRQTCEILAMLPESTDDFEKLLRAGVEAFRFIESGRMSSSQFIFEMITVKLREAGLYPMYEHGIRLVRKSGKDIKMPQILTIMSEEIASRREHDHPMLDKRNSSAALGVNAVRAIRGKRPANKYFCDYCKERSHTKDKCFKLNPCKHCNEKGHNPRRCPARKETPAANSATASGGKFGARPVHINLTAQSMGTDIPVITEHSKRFAWDSAADYHMSSFRTDFISLQPAEGLVIAGGNKEIKIEGIGTVGLRLDNDDEVLMDNVYYVPGLDRRLMSQNGLVPPPSDPLQPN